MYKIKEQSYTSKSLNDLTADELRDAKTNLLANRVICPHCLGWTDKLRKVPNRFLQKPNMTYFSELDAPLVHQLLLDFEKKKTSCDYCIAAMAQKKRKQQERLWLENKGIIVIREHEKISGFVYIAVFTEGQYKIGSTIRDVRSRLVQNVFYTPQDFIHAIFTEIPRGLEDYLHRRYKKKNVKMNGQKEVFALSEGDLEWIYSLVSINSKAVYHFTQLKLATPAHIAEKYTVCSARFEHGETPQCPK